MCYTSCRWFKRRARLLDQKHNIFFSMTNPWYICIYLPYKNFSIKIQQSIHAGPVDIIPVIPMDPWVQMDPIRFVFVSCRKGIRKQKPWAFANRPGIPQRYFSTRFHRENVVNIQKLKPGSKLWSSERFYQNVFTHTFIHVVDPYYC